MCVASVLIKIETYYFISSTVLISNFFWALTMAKPSFGPISAITSSTAAFSFPPRLCRCYLKARSSFYPILAHALALLGNLRNPKGVGKSNLSKQRVLLSTLALRNSEQ